MLRSLLNQLILAIFTWFLCGVSVYALQTDLLNDPKIVKALQEDEITIVKIEKILTDVNVSKTKQGYTVIMAKARMPKVKDLGYGELKNARNPWSMHGFCVYARNCKNDLHMLFVILNHKKKLDAIVYEQDLTVALETKVDLSIDKVTNYEYAYKADKTVVVFALSSEGCDTNRNFAYTPNGYGMVLPNGFFDNMED